jgi:hypothetical protein
MKLILKALIFFVTATPLICIAEWTKIGTSDSGDVFYIDFDTIKKHEGFIYVWKMNDYITPEDDGSISSKVYHKLDCNLNRSMSLQFIFYKESLGKGPGETNSPKNPEWRYAPPGTVLENIITLACNYKKRNVK